MPAIVPILAFQLFAPDALQLPERLLPQYTPCVYQNERYACFDQAQTLQLNYLETYAKYWHSQWLEEKERADNYSLLSTTYTQVLEKQQEMMRDDQQQINTLYNQLAAETEAKNNWRAKAEDPPTWPLWVGGALAALGTGAFLSSLVR